MMRWLLLLLTGLSSTGRGGRAHGMHHSSGEKSHRSQKVGDTLHKWDSLAVLEQLKPFSPLKASSSSRALGKFLLTRNAAAGFSPAYAAGNSCSTAHWSSRCIHSTVTPPACVQRSPSHVRLCATLEPPTSAASQPGYMERLKGTLPLLVDTALSAAGAGFTIYLLSILETPSFKLYGPPLAASAAIAFYRKKPPAPREMCVATLGATSFAVVLYQLFGEWSPATRRSLAVAAALTFFRLTGNVFPPAAALCALFEDKPAFPDQAWKYPLFPCLSGNLAIWGLAKLLSHVRAYVRGLLVK